MAYLQHWMKSPDMGCVDLLSADSDVYERPDLKELITVKRHQGNSLTAAVMGDMGRVWRKMVRGVRGISHFRSKKAY
jgi:hypothetical protein